VTLRERSRLREALVESAVHYAARGWPVFPVYEVDDAGRCQCGQPCESPGKHPRIAHGFKMASTDASQIRMWWSHWSGANIGIATGATAGLIVLDEDPQKGGTESLAALEAKYGPLPSTVEALTGGDGRHLYLRHPGPGMEVPSSVGKLGPGLDIRADGGYVIAPPSTHRSGRSYEWEVLHQPTRSRSPPRPTGSSGSPRRPAARMGQGRRRQSMKRLPPATGMPS
jgi:putative DNA primase/helicase